MGRENENVKEGQKSEQDKNLIPNLDQSNHINHKGDVTNVVIHNLTLNIGNLVLHNNFFSNNNTTSSIPEASLENHVLGQINVAKNTKVDITPTKGEQVKLYNVTLEPAVTITNAISVTHKGETGNMSSSVNANFEPFDNINAIQLRLISESGEILKQGNIITLPKNNSLKCDILEFTAPGKFENKSEETAIFASIKFRSKEADTSKFKDVIEVIFDGSKIMITGIVNINGDEQLVKDQCILQDYESMPIAGNDSNIDHGYFL